MYKTKTTFTISAAHKLNLDYDSPCSHFHGHNWVITVYCQSDKLNKNDMLIDFKQIKDLVKNKIDHKAVNDAMDENPTAENMAREICRWINDISPVCYKVDVQETEGNIASYEKDNS